jgi:hypothetical protein
MKNSTIHNSLFSIPVYARVRYRQPLFEATLQASANSESKTNKRVKLKSVNSKPIRYSLIFKNPQKFVAPGQSAVLYVPRRSRAKADQQITATRRFAKQRYGKRRLWVVYVAKASLIRALSPSDKSDGNVFS